MHSYSYRSYIAARAHVKPWRRVRADIARLRFRSIARRAPFYVRAFRALHRFVWRLCRYERFRPPAAGRSWC